jgi:hypothetical protein
MDLRCVRVSRPDNNGPPDMSLTHDLVVNVGNRPPDSTRTGNRWTEPPVEFELPGFRVSAQVTVSWFTGVLYFDP